MSAHAHRQVSPKAATLELALALKARELADFCLRRGPALFRGWHVPTLWAYCFFHIMTRTAYVVREHGQIVAAGFAWGLPETDLRELAKAGSPIFQWRVSDDAGDAVFIAEVVGGKNHCGRLLRQAKVRLKGFEGKHLFTFRAGPEGPQLVQVPLPVIERLCHGRR